jgi:hypothetical protein
MGVRLEECAGAEHRRVDPEGIDLYRRWRSTSFDATFGVPPAPPNAIRLASKL